MVKRNSRKFSTNRISSFTIFRILYYIVSITLGVGYERELEKVFHDRTSPFITLFSENFRSESWEGSRERVQKIKYIGRRRGKICNNVQEIPFHHHLFKKRASIKENSRKTREIVTFAQMVYITDIHRRLDNNHSSPRRSSILFLSFLDT